MKADKTTYAATIGFFDGVHRGHQFLISQVEQTAADRGQQSMVVTFRQHPRKVLNTDYQPQLLTTQTEKLELLSRTGADRVVWLDFTHEMAQMSARDFMLMLYRNYSVRTLVVGYDHQFGHGRTEGFEDYVHYGQEIGMEVIQARQLPGGISSTVVRTALLQGDILQANAALGHPFFLQGKVVHGFHNGTRLGFPTANLQVPAEKLLPGNGSYLVRVLTAGQTTPLAGMLNIGTRPTMHNGAMRSVEVYILDFSGDLYGQTIRLELVDFLRAEQQFLSTDELQKQLEADEAECRRRMSAAQAQAGTL